MKILFLVSRLPYPPNRGDKIRVFNFLSRLGKRHSITLVSFIESKDQQNDVAELKKHCARVEVVLLSPWESYLNCFFGLFSGKPLQVAYYGSAKMRRKLTALLNEEKYDAAYIHLFRMAGYASVLKDVNCAVDLCDAVSLHMQRTIKYNRSYLWPVYFIESLRIGNYERDVVGNFHKVIFIAEQDRDAVKKDAPGTWIIPNGVDSEYFKPPEGPLPAEPKAAFLGYLKTFYNVDAALYFYQKIFPLIKKKIANIKFMLIGASPAERIRRLLKHSDIELHFDVEDTRPYLSQASVFVCPFRVCSGVQNKILEAMAMGCPVITTSRGAAGLIKDDTGGYFVADDPGDFADLAVRLLADQEARQKSSICARDYVKKHYNWDQAAKNLEDLLSDGH